MTVIICPSYKRATGLKTHLLIPDVVYCVGESEKDEYIKQNVNVMSMPDKMNGNIARVRNWILEQNKDENVLLVDDDIEHIRRWNKRGERWHRDNLNTEQIEQLIDNGFSMCQESGARLWGVNPADSKFAYREANPFNFNCYVSGSFSGFIKPDLRYDEELPLKEDYDMTLQQCNKYRKVLRLNMYHLIKNDHGNLGGCATYRTSQREKEQMELFRKKWGNKIVKYDVNSVESFDINPIIRVPIKGV
jgi:hypothetical protein